MTSKIKKLLTGLFVFIFGTSVMASNYYYDRPVQIEGHQVVKTAIVLCADDSEDKIQCDYVCDGTNDEVQFIAAISTGRKVIIRSGNYYIEPELIFLLNDTTIEGAGARDSVIIHMNASAGANARIFRIEGTVGAYKENVEIRNLYLINDENALGTEPDTGTFGLKTSYARNIIVENIRTEMFHTPIEFNDSEQILCSHLVDYSGEQGTVNGAKNLVSIRGANSMVIEDCIGYTNDTIFRIQGGKNIKIHNNDIYYGSVEIGNAEGRGYSENIFVTNNNFIGNTTNAIGLATFSVVTDQLKTINGYTVSVNNIHIINNTFSFGSTTSPAAIHIGGSAAVETVGVSNIKILNNIIEGNTAASAKSYGITVNYSTQPGFCYICDIHNNTITNVNSYGIQLYNVINGNVSNNFIINHNGRDNVDGVGFNSGIWVKGTATTTSENIKIYNNTIDSNNTTEGTGIYVDNASYIEKIEIYRNTFLNATNVIDYATSVPSNSITRDNIGYVTEANGTGSITSGSTSDIITHGLDVTPTAKDISITLTENPTNTAGNIWVDTIGATYFTVNCENDPGASNLDFEWSAIVL